MIDNHYEEKYRIQWQDTVCCLIIACALLVVIIGGLIGMRWTIQQIALGL